MTTRHFTKIADPNHGHAWVRCKTGKSKNHQNDSQDLRKGGLIPFGKNKFGFDSGLFIEDYQKHLNPGNKNMFQRPKYGKAFTKNLHKKKKQEVYYCNTKVGHTYVGKFMPKVYIIISNKFALEFWLQIFWSQSAYLGSCSWSESVRNLGIETRHEVGT